MGIKVLTIVGARPQFIKAAALSREIKNRNDISEIIVHTGQHFDPNMSKIFFMEMDIPEPNYNLGISGGSHGDMTGKMLIEIEKILLIENPDWVIVYGDTNSTLAGALAAAKLNIRVAHIEAGLRSFNMNMPEEKNRILTDRLSTVLFCPTEIAIKNLQKEGYEGFEVKIINVGDIMLDAAMYYSKKITGIKIISDFNFDSDYVLATCHRAENTDCPSRMSEIVEALNKISKDTRVIVPLHPRTRKKIDLYGLSIDFDVIEPVGYFDMLSLIINSNCVLTDSGGLQKEAYFFKKPCVTMRDETEWMELVNCGVNIIAGASADKILSSFQQVLKIKNFPDNLYGRGTTSNDILDTLVSNF